MSSPLTVGLVATLIAAGVLLSSKPDLMFTAKGQFKPLGPGPSETLLPFWLAILLAGVVFYYLTMQKR